MTAAGNRSVVFLGAHPHGTRAEVRHHPLDTFDVLVDGAEPVIDPAPTSLQLGVGQTGLGQTQVQRVIEVPDKKRHRDGLISRALEVITFGMSGEKGRQE